MIKNPDWARSEDRCPLSNGRATAPFVAAERGFIYEVIEPAQTRSKLIRAVREQARHQPAEEARQYSVVK